MDGLDSWLAGWLRYYGILRTQIAAHARNSLKFTNTINSF